MKKLHIALLIAFAFTSLATAQSNVRVRGTIVGLNDDVLVVKSREGQEVKLQLAKDATVGVATKFKFEDIKKGDYLGATSVKQADGRLVALEVHYLPPTAAAGHTPWDLQPGSTMTNANVEAIVQGAKGRELTLKYKDGMQTLLVPEGIPLVRAVPGKRSDLKPGEYVFAIAQPSPDGKMTALRVQVSKDGVKPPQ